MMRWPVAIVLHVKINFDLIPFNRIEKATISERIQHFNGMNQSSNQPTYQKSNASIVWHVAEHARSREHTHTHITHTHRYMYDVMRGHSRNEESVHIN